MFPSTPIHKESDTHEIYIEINPESVINGKYLARQLTTLAMLLEPDSERSCYSEDYYINFKTKSNYKPEDFFVEHQLFLNKLSGQHLEN
jgi:hypothetical protein